MWKWVGRGNTELRRGEGKGYGEGNTPLQRVGADQLLGSDLRGSIAKSAVLGEPGAALLPSPGGCGWRWGSPWLPGAQALVAQAVWQLEQE